MAGYVGTQQRTVYSCIGGTVNLAALQKSHTKEGAARDVRKAAPQFGRFGCAVQPINEQHFSRFVRLVELRHAGGTALRLNPVAMHL